MNNSIGFWEPPRARIASQKTRPFRIQHATLLKLEKASADSTSARLAVITRCVTAGEDMRKPLAKRL